MLRLMTLLTGMALLVPVASAEPSSAVAFDLPTVKLLKSGDPGSGKALTEDKHCAKCHGDAGVSEDPDDVNIAGLSASYLYKQLKDYQDKKRQDKVMYKNVKDLTDTQMADLAAWYTSLEPAKADPNRTTSSEVRTLVFHGDPDRLLKACASCHGRKGRGGQFDHPALSGQHRTYLVDSMTAFKEQDRTNDIYGRMRDASKGLTEEEMGALADYYAVQLPARQ